MLNNRVDLINNFFFFIEYVQLRTVVDRSYNKKVTIKSLEGDNFLYTMIIFLVILIDKN